jgi:RNA polymerase sigma-70 factor (ECF subfamily)
MEITKEEQGSNFSPRAKEDLELVKLANGGDQQAYAKLMHRYKDSIYFSFAEDGA